MQDTSLEIKTETNQQPLGPTRRQFLVTTGAVILSVTAASSAMAAAPTVRTANKSGSRLPIIGQGAHTYEVRHDWVKPPKNIPWNNTHAVCFDKNGMLYIFHQTNTKEPLDAILVFDEEGKFVRSFGKEFHQGGHGLEIREENGQEFLYLCDIHHRCVVKMDMQGKQVWKISYPEESGLYKNIGGFKPTNIAFNPDGGFYVGDGYGSSYIHQYDQEAKWIRSWGGVGSAKGKLSCPHGLWLDDRPGREVALAVADRSNQRIQYFSLAGKHLSFVEGLIRPCHFDILGEVLLVPDLNGRITLLDKENKLITHLANDAEWTKKITTKGYRYRSQGGDWPAGKFVHPHDACFDKQGNIFVGEWVVGGRISKLSRVEA